RLLSSPAVAARRRKNVPYNGPLAPPTELTSFIPVRLKSVLRSPGGSASAADASGSSSTTALIPRCMLMPWSPSPMAESSSVSQSFSAAIRSANPRSQAVATATSSVSLTRPFLPRLQRVPPAAPSRPPPQAGGRHRGVPQLEQVVVHLEQRDRAAGH